MAVVRPPKAYGASACRGVVRAGRSGEFGRGPCVHVRDLPVSAWRMRRGTLRWLVLDRAEVSQGQRIAGWFP